MEPFPTHKKRIITKSRLISLLVLLCTAHLFAQDSFVSRSATSFEQTLAVEWDNYIRHKLSNDQEEREQAFNNFQKLKDQTGAEIFETGSRLFLEEGYKDLAKNDLENARQEFHNARKLNPRSWAAFEGLAKVKAASGDGFGQVLRVRLNGMFAALSLDNTWLVLDGLDWLTTNLIYGLRLILVLVTLAFFFKYIRQFYKSTVNTFEEHHYSDLVCQMAAVFFLGLPLLLGFTYFVAACLYLILLFPFLQPRERFAAILTACIPAILPLIGVLNLNIASARSDQLFKLQQSQFVQGSASGLLDRFEAMPRLDDRTKLQKGLLLKHSGYLQNALNTFEELENSQQWRGHALINKGNIQYLAKDYQEALETFQSAATVKDVRNLALYNQSLVKGKQGLHDEAERLRRQANLTPQQQRLTIEQGRVLDAYPDNRAQVIDRLFMLNGDDLKNHALPYIALTLLTIGLALVHTRFRNSKLLAKACDKCGRIYFESDSPESDWCSQCVSLYVQKEDLPSEAKIRKHDEVTRFNKMKRQGGNLGQLTLPGIKKLVGGNAINGLFTLAVWILLLIFCIFPITQQGHFSLRFIDVPPLPSILCIAITIVYWLTFGLRSMLQED